MQWLVTEVTDYEMERTQRQRGVGYGHWTAAQSPSETRAPGELMSCPSLGSCKRSVIISEGYQFPTREARLRRQKPCLRTCACRYSVVSFFM
jgi:hypothetical protein